MTSREAYERDGQRRFGERNPDHMRVPHWEYMIRTGADPYWVRKELGLDPMPEAPGWCFERFGMSRTQMPDGRIICIAGEHEDSYDPDFCIYNDVIVLRPTDGAGTVTRDSGEVEIYGFPDSLFPPTDFHSATLIGQDIYIIGSLGYAGRRGSETPVFRLDTTSYRIEPVAARGPSPGWIYRHHAEYEPERHAIVVRGGEREAPESGRNPPNFSAYRLLLGTGEWEVISPAERHRRFLLTATSADAERFSEPGPEVFRPRTVGHRWLGTHHGGVDVHSISVSRVRISFEVFYTEVRTIIEGDVEETLIRKILEEIQQSLHQRTGAPWSVQEVARFENEFQSPEELGEWLERTRRELGLGDQGCPL